MDRSEAWERGAAALRALAASAAETAPPPSIWSGVAAGLAGGLAGTLAMTAAQRALHALGERLSPPDGASSGGERADGGSPPATEQVAARVAQPLVAGRLGERERAIGGQVVHYGFGTAMGGVYGWLAERAPVATAGHGLAFGTALMLVADELLVPLLRLSPPPQRIPAGTHAYALASHLVYGVVAESVRRVARQRGD